MVTIFDNLPDLSLIEVFSYLSCFDVLYSFSNLNVRLTALIAERGFFHHFNLSSARYDQFHSILSTLRLNEIQSLIIDCYASPLRLKTWPHLPHLKSLTVKGVRDRIDVFNFCKAYGNTLTHLAVQSNKYFCTVSPDRNRCQLVSIKRK